MVNDSLELYGVMDVAGTRGYSAYEVAQQNGYTGTEEEWLESLRGDIGPQGTQGIEGPQGPVGPTPRVRAGTVTKLNPEDNPYVNVTGTPEVPIFNFGIPQGQVGPAGTTQYNDLNGKPTLNGVTLQGAVTLNDIGAQPAGEYVTPTDYATNNKGGVVVITDTYGLIISTSGILSVAGYSYANYLTKSENTAISKQTLENVITGKDLTTKAYVDGLVGDINEALDLLNGEVI